MIAETRKKKKRAKLEAGLAAEPSVPTKATEPVAKRPKTSQVEISMVTDDAPRSAAITTEKPEGDSSTSSSKKKKNKKKNNKNKLLS